MYSGKQMLSADFLIFSANRSFLLRKRMMEVSMKNLLLQMESNSIRDSCMRFCRGGRRRRRLMAGGEEEEVEEEKEKEEGEFRRDKNIRWEDEGRIRRRGAEEQGFIEVT